MLRQHVVLLLLIGLSLLECINSVNAGGVYPNYHAHFDFVGLDTEKTLSEWDAEKKWWQTASFYQIYPRSFKDSDGDGIGDLKGITQQLEYLKEIGIAGTWLSPIFTSPMIDFGYDIANFTEIDPIFGTIADFDALIVKANKLGIKILLDFVPNHSSDKCEWFQKSAANDPYYKDFYVWHPGKMVNGVRQPPSNWISVFRGSAWTWHEGRQEYYLHQFTKQQPDLNYRNPKVQETMKDVLRYWLRKGVYGFRIDAVSHIYEIAANENGDYPDEPNSNNVPDPDDYAYLNHIYTFDQPENLNTAYEWRRVMDDFQKENGGEERVLMAELSSQIDVVMKFYGNSTVEGVQIPFNFLFLNWVTNDSDAYHYAEAINTWLKNMPEGRTANWVIGNHDRNRVGSRLSADRIDMLNILIMTLSGCSVTYNGEEIGMLDVWISWNDTVDPAACNSNPSIYERFSRDPERTPFQWSDEKNAGFSTGNKTWLPLGDNYRTVNVKLERGIPLSHLNIFKQLHGLRQLPTLRHGDIEIKAVISNAVLGVKRSLLNEHTFVTLLNIFDNIETVDLTKVFKNLPQELQYVLVTDKSQSRVGDMVKSESIRLMPKEAVVLRSPTKLTTSVGYYAYYKPKE